MLKIISSERRNDFYQPMKFESPPLKGADSNLHWSKLLFKPRAVALVTHSEFWRLDHWRIQTACRLNFQTAITSIIWNKHPLGCGFKSSVV